MLPLTAVVTKKRVLVVDDEPGILRIVRINLSLAGYEVLTTASGEEAIRLSQSESPDIVLLDVLLRPLDGLQVLKRLRDFSQVPVLLFTARSYTADQALEVGANGIIAKPFRPDELVKKIKDVLEDPHTW